MTSPYSMLVVTQNLRACQQETTTHLWSKASKVHLTKGWYHSSSSEPALAAASGLNTSSIACLSLIPAEDHAPQNFVIVQYYGSTLPKSIILFKEAMVPKRANGPHQALRAHYAL